MYLVLFLAPMVMALLMLATVVPYLVRRMTLGAAAPIPEDTGTPWEELLEELADPTLIRRARHAYPRPLISHPVLTVLLIVACYVGACVPSVRVGAGDPSFRRGESTGPPPPGGWRAGNHTHQLQNFPKRISHIRIHRGVGLSLYWSILRRS